MSYKKLYLITGTSPFKDQIKILKRVLPLGIDLIQYRSKNTSFMTQLNEAYQLKMLCTLYQTPLVINDSVALAKAIGAQGIHLGASDGASDLSFGIRGRTVKSVDAAKMANEECATYIGVGAFFPSKTKEKALPMDANTLKTIRTVAKMPIFAIGGITPERVTSDLYSNVDGFAFSDVLWSSKAPEQVIMHFKSLSF